MEKKVSVVNPYLKEAVAKILKIEKSEVPDSINEVRELIKVAKEAQRG